MSDTSPREDRLTQTQSSPSRYDSESGFPASRLCCSSHPRSLYGVLRFAWQRTNLRMPSSECVGVRGGVTEAPQEAGRAIRYERSRRNLCACGVCRAMRSAAVAFGREGGGRSALAAVANLHIGSHPYHHDRGHAPGQLQDPPIPSSFEHACVDAVWPCHAVRPYAYVGIVYGISISSCMRTSFSHSRLSIPALKMPE